MKGLVYMLETGDVDIQIGEKNLNSMSIEENGGNAPTAFTANASQRIGRVFVGSLSGSARAYVMVLNLNAWHYPVNYI